MKLFGRGNADSTNDNVDSTAEAPAIETVGKGRPTPKRRDAEGRKRGPVAPAPMTQKEARARRKATRGNKQERKEASNEKRATAAERRQRMLAGEDAYLLPRDKGPVRAFVRDFVDARRNLVGMFMPLALLLILTMFISPALQQIVTLAMLIMMLFMVIEGVYLGRKISNLVHERFPDSIESGRKLGWYAFVRASQIRKMRAPKPRVSPGDPI